MLYKKLICHSEKMQFRQHLGNMIPYKLNNASRYLAFFSRLSACHAGGRGFEPRRSRQKHTKAREVVHSRAFAFFWVLFRLNYAAAPSKIPNSPALKATCLRKTLHPPAKFCYFRETTAVKS